MINPSFRTSQKHLASTMHLARRDISESEDFSPLMKPFVVPMAEDLNEGNAQHNDAGAFVWANARRTRCAAAE